MNRKLIFYLVALFILCLLVMGGVASKAQAPKSAATPTASPVDTPKSLVLTDAELKEFEPLFKDNTLRAQDLKAAFDALLSTDVVPVTSGGDARAAIANYKGAYRLAREAEAAINGWFERTKTAPHHDCKDCVGISQDGKSLVKAVEAGKK